MPIKQIATRIVTTLQNEGHIAYFAGGWVRDQLLKHPSDDIDIATSASVEEIQSLFSKTIPVGVSFGIIIVVEEQYQFEVATFRKESEYIDGRRPSRIERATAQEDAMRRDFTINGMFFDPVKEELLDFVKGEEDLKKKILRAIGNPQDRFHEDKLRMIRAVRYTTRFQLTIDEGTKQAILEQAHTLFPSVAIERIWQEFQKMASFAHFGTCVEMLYELGLLEEIFPKIKSLPSAEIKKRLEPFFSFPKHLPLIIEILHLFPDDSLEEHLALCDTLKLSSQEKNSVRFFHQAQPLLNQTPTQQENIELWKWAHFYAHPESDILLKLWKAPQAFHQQNQHRLSSHILRLKMKTPLVKAEDLIRHNIAPGPSMGDLLREAEKISITYLLEDKHDVLERLKHTSIWDKAPRSE